MHLLLTHDTEGMPCSTVLFNPQHSMKRMIKLLISTAASNQTTVNYTENSDQWINAQNMCLKRSVSFQQSHVIIIRLCFHMTSKLWWDYSVTWSTTRGSVSTGPAPNEACFCFGLGFKWEDHTPRTWSQVLMVASPALYHQAILPSLS